MFARSLPLYLFAFPILGLLGCGGGSGGGGSSSPPPPPPGFTLSLSPAQIDLSQSATQNVQIQAVPQNGFSGSVTVTATGLPSGVTASPSSVTVSIGSPGTLVFAAASNATSGTAQVPITGNSGSLQASANLGLNVIQATTPIPVPFTTTGGGIVKAFYDESRKLLFAGNLYLNEVDVLSGNDLSVQARIPVGQPFGIDQMPDGNTLVVGSFTQGFYTINENTLAVTHYLAPNFSQTLSTTVLLTPVAMANGKVLFLGKDMGADTPSDFIYGGQYVIEWDSTTGVFSLTMWFGLAGEIDNLKRSADHNWAVFAADKMYIYGSASDSFVSSVDPINNSEDGVIPDVAANPNGTQFAAVSPISVSFYDSAFDDLGTVSTDPTTGMVFTFYNTQYSSDGSLLYRELDGSVVDVVDTTSFTDIGNVTSDLGVQTQFEPDLLLVDSSQRAFLSALGGVGILNVSKLRSGIPEMAGGIGPNPGGIPLNQTVAVTLNPTNSALPVGTSVTFGGLLAPVESNNPNNNPMVVQVPASSVAGPVNLVVTQPDGETLVEPQYFSYGVDVAAPTSTLVPPIGNPVMGLFGFGMLNGPTTPPAVTVGGQTVRNMAVNPEANYILQELFLQVPNGSPGPADITVTGNNGTGTLTAAVTYIPSAAIIPASGLLQLLYDPTRSLLYALQSTQIQVFSPANLQWQTPLRPGSSGGVGYVSMTMTPDAAHMLVLDATAGTLTVFNPDNPSQSVSTLLTTDNGATLQSVAATSTGKAFIGSFGGRPIEFDLATNTQAKLNIYPGALAKLVATPDGRYMAGVDEVDNFGTLATWQSASDSFTTQGFTEGISDAGSFFWSDIAISPNGNLFAALAGGVAYAGVAVCFFDEGLHFTDATVYPDLAPPDEPFSTGAIFSASGLTLLSPLGDSIDFFNTQTARLQGRLLTPEALPEGDACSGVIALDPNQQTIYAITTSGLAVLTLPSVVDNITPFSWPYVAKPPHSVPATAQGRLGATRRGRRDVPQRHFPAASSRLH
jgi:hypothetical protein